MAEAEEQPKEEGTFNDIIGPGDDAPKEDL